MKIVSVKEMRELDRIAIEEYGIPSIVLMENAGLRSFDCVVHLYKDTIFDAPIVIVCGGGNNGGDGFVLARHLLNYDCEVRVFIFADKNRIKGDAFTNLAILEKMNTPVTYVADTMAFEDFKKCVKRSAFVVDALFGTGLEREVKNPIKAYIEYINSSKKEVVSLDSPSGLSADSGEILGVAIRATHTITMGAAKKGFFIGEGHAHTGEIHVVDISIPREVIPD